MVEIPSHDSSGVASLSVTRAEWYHPAWSRRLSSPIHTLNCLLVAKMSSRRPVGPKFSVKA